jgi:hypothetical protein
MVKRTFGPKVCQPVQTGELEIFQFASGFREIVRIGVEPFEHWSLVFRIICAAVWELALCLPPLIRRDLGFGGYPDHVMGFPGAVLVAQASPLAEVFNQSVGGLALRNDAFNLLIIFLFFLLAFLVEEESLVVFSRELWGLQACMVDFVSFDVVIYTLQALVTLQEFVRFVCVVQVGEVLPLDMEPLSK